MPGSGSPGTVSISMTSIGPSRASSRGSAKRWRDTPRLASRAGPGTSPTLRARSSTCPSSRCTRVQLRTSGRAHRPRRVSRFGALPAGRGNADTGVLSNTSGEISWNAPKAASARSDRVTVRACSPVLQREHIARGTPLVALIKPWSVKIRHLRTTSGCTARVMRCYPSHVPKVVENEAW